MSEVKRAVIDTNVLVYDAFTDTVFHKEAATTLETLDEWVIPSIVIHEFVWVLRELGLEPNIILEFVQQYLFHRKAKFVPELKEQITAALEHVIAEQLSISRYNDKVILTHALKMNVPIATFDRKLRNQAKKVGVRVLPIKIPKK